MPCGIPHNGMDMTYQEPSHLLTLRSSPYPSLMACQSPLRKKKKIIIYNLCRRFPQPFPFLHRERSPRATVNPSEMPSVRHRGSSCAGQTSSVCRMQIEKLTNWLALTYPTTLRCNGVRKISVGYDCSC